MTKKPIIMIGAPIQNREEIMNDYLNHIYTLNYPKDRIKLAFFINNSTDKTYELVKEFTDLHSHEYNETIVWKKKVLKGKLDDQTRFRRDFVLFSIVRNTFLKRILRTDFDYLYSIDSDILVPPDSLTLLLGHDKDIISALIENGEFKGDMYYNVYQQKAEDVYHVFLTDWLNQQTEPFEVDVTGACYLINRKVLDAGVKYSYYHQGEDGGFCRSAQDKGFKLYCDPTIRPVHLLHGKVDYSKQMGRLKVIH